MSGKRNKKMNQFVRKSEFSSMLMKQAEAKRATFTESSATLTTALPFEEHLTDLAQGNGASTRVGHEIQVTGVYVRGFFSPSHDDTNPTTSAYMARVVLYTPRDLLFAAIDPLPGEIIDKDQVIVWYDRLIAVPWTNSISSNQFTIRKKFKPYMKVMWDGSAGSTIVNNDIRLVITTNSGTDFIETSYQASLYFRDV